MEREVTDWAVIENLSLWWEYLIIIADAGLERRRTSWLPYSDDRSCLGKLARTLRCFDIMVG